MLDHIGEILLIVLNAGVFSLIVMVFRSLSKSLGIEKNVGIMVQKLDDSCEAFQRQINRLNQEKDRILAEGDKEHTRIEKLILNLEDKVEDYQSKFHVRSEDIVWIKATLEATNREVSNLSEEVTALRDEVRNNKRVHA